MRAQIVEKFRGKQILEEYERKRDEVGEKRRTQHTRLGRTLMTRNLIIKVEKRNDRQTRRNTEVTIL